MHISSALTEYVLGLLVIFKVNAATANQQKGSSHFFVATFPCVVVPCATSLANRTIGVRSAIQCSAECCQQNTCTSFNYKKKGQSSNCELFYYPPNAFQPVNDCTYYTVYLYTMNDLLYIKLDMRDRLCLQSS